MVVATAQQREKRLLSSEKCQNLDGFSIFGNFNDFQYSFFDQAKPTYGLPPPFQVPYCASMVAAAAQGEKRFKVHASGSGYYPPKNAEIFVGF